MRELKTAAFLILGGKIERKKENEKKWLSQILESTRVAKICITVVELEF